jgi:hypothetical protein
MSGRLSPKKAITALAVVPVVMMATVALSGCAGGPDENEPGTTPPPAAPTGTPAETPSADASGAVPDAAGTPIVLEIAGQEIRGRLDASPTATSLVAQLPLTLVFADHGGQEKYAELPAPLDLTGAPQSSDAQPLQIGYYVPDQRLILYYAFVGTFSGIVPIGSYDSADAIEEENDDFTITIREAD